MNNGRLMNKLIRLFTVMILFLSGCRGVSDSTPSGAAAQSSENTELQENKEAKKDAETIIILHTNDVHCGLDEKIGYDGLYLYKEEMKQKYENVLLVDAGDSIQGGTYGTLSKGNIIIDLMNDVGYDCATLGNHEFDYGFEVLDDLSEKLKCGYICANFCTADGETVFEPYRIFDLAGKRIAFIGIDTPSTFTKSSISTMTDDQGIPMYDFMADDTGDRLAACVQKNVDEVRSKGADIVILLAHLGNSEGDELRYHSEEVIAKTNGIDVLIDGHEHAKTAYEMKNKDGEPVLSEQTGTKLESIGKIIIQPDNTIVGELVEEIPEPEGIEAELVTRKKKDYWVDSSIKKKIEEYISSYDEILNRKIGEISYDLPSKNAEGDSLGKTQEIGLLNLLTDAMREVGESEIALFYGGGVRNGLEKGEILFSDVVQAFPYANDVLVVSVEGQDILDALEYGARRLPLECNGLIHGSGLEYTIDLAIPSAVKEDANGVFIRVDGPYRVKNVLINGLPLDPDKKYTAAMNNYLQGGGDGMSMMKNSQILQYTQKVENVLLSDYIEQNLGGIVPEEYKTPEGRINIIGKK